MSNTMDIQRKLEPSLQTLLIDYMRINDNDINSYINEDRKTISKLVELLMLNSYNATAAEVNNHDEINEQLYIIRELLEKIYKKIASD
jgi:hypothetical protein